MGSSAPALHMELGKQKPPKSPSPAHPVAFHEWGLLAPPGCVVLAGRPSSSARGSRCRLRTTTRAPAPPCPAAGRWWSRSASPPSSLRPASSEHHGDGTGAARCQHPWAHTPCPGTHGWPSAPRRDPAPPPQVLCACRRGWAGRPTGLGSFLKGYGNKWLLSMVGLWLRSPRALPPLPVPGVAEEPALIGR